MRKGIKSFDGTHINYDICREKNKNGFLIFLHGTGNNLKMWKKIRLFFHKRGIPTLAVDLRGHGKSGKPKSVGDYRIRHFAKDVKAVIRKEHILHPVIIGYSLGGMVALAFHGLYPNFSKSYVIISSSYKTPKLFKNLFKRFSFFVKFLNKRLRPASMRSLLFTIEGISKFNESGIIATIKKPVLILSGDKDVVVDVSNSKRMSKKVKNSKLKIFPKKNHFIIGSIPKEISKEIYSFIEKAKIPIKKK
jgi:pimeloyl-ACP methyl ester carboxylesterase